MSRFHRTDIAQAADDAAHEYAMRETPPTPGLATPPAPPTWEPCGRRSCTHGVLRRRSGTITMCPVCRERRLAADAAYATTMAEYMQQQQETSNG